MTNNTGNCNAGYWNTGDRNTRNRNTGNCNAGYWNTGDRNTGNCNTGYCNTGDWNTGNCNTGDWNTGNCNTGNRNTGNWNKGDWNTGYCNTITPDDCFIFNKLAKRSDWDDADKPYWMFAQMTKWIDKNDMTDKEKEAYPSYTTTGGYLKCFSSLQHSYIEAWENADEEDRAKTFNLPNFDVEVFQEIFGFNPCQEKKKVTLELTDEQLEKIKEIINV